MRDRVSSVFPSLTDLDLRQHNVMVRAPTVRPAQLPAGLVCASDMLGRLSKLAYRAQSVCEICVADGRRLAIRVEIVMCQTIACGGAVL